MVTVVVALAAGVVGGAARRVGLTRAVSRVARLDPVPARVTAGLRSALGDPSITVDLVDPSGAPEPGGGRFVVTVGAPGAARVVRVGMDPGTRRRRARVAAVLAAARPTLETMQLRAAHDAELARARAARRDIASAAMAQRHRLERALHDGAQQTLLALAFQVEVAAMLLVGEPGPSGALAGAAAELRAAHAALRRLAGSAFPPLLDAAGPAAALGALAERLPMEVRVRAGLERCDPAAEAAAYFAVADLLGDLAGSAAPAAVDVAVEVGATALRIGLTHAAAVGSGVRRLVADRLAAFDGHALFTAAGCVVEVPCR